MTNPESYQPLTMADVDTRWQHWQREMAQKLHATFVVATDAGHRVHSDAPELVASLVQAFIDAARSHGQPKITAHRLAALPGKLVRATTYGLTEALNLVHL